MLMRCPDKPSVKASFCYERSHCYMSSRTRETNLNLLVQVVLQDHVLQIPLISCNLSAVMNVPL